MNVWGLAMNKNQEQSLYGSLLCVINAAMERAKEAEKNELMPFANLHRENALGALAMWSAIAHEDSIKKYQDSLLDVIYK